MKPCWNIEDIKQLNFETPSNPTRGFNFIDEIDAHRYKNIIAHIHKGLPDCINIDAIQEEFYWLDNKNYSVSKMKPGDILPLHYDKYSYYRSVVNADINDICRVIVFLDDWKLGHFLHIQGKEVKNWKAGDYAEWIGATVHAAGNLGHEDRYILQITGVLNGLRYRT